MSLMSIVRPAASRALAALLLLAPLCAQLPAQDPAKPSAESQEADAPKTLPIPVPFPLTIPVPVEIARLDQQNAYSNVSANLAYVNVFAIVARDETTGDFGVAAVSSTPAVGALLAAAKANAGAALVCARPNMAWRDRAIELLAAGKSAKEVVEEITGAKEFEQAAREMAVIDREGKTAGFIGTTVLGDDSRTHMIEGENCIVVACQVGRFHPKTPAMLQAFEASKGFPLPERLLLALQAGWAAEPPPGTAGADPMMFFDTNVVGGGLPACSAALLVVRDKGGYDERSDRLVDVRVDLSKDPVPRLIESYYAWVAAMIVPRLPQMLGYISDVESAAYKLNQEWLTRARRGTPIGQK